MPPAGPDRISGDQISGHQIGSERLTSFFRQIVADCEQRITELAKLEASS